MHVVGQWIEFPARSSRLARAASTPVGHFSSSSDEYLYGPGVLWRSFDTAAVGPEQHALIVVCFWTRGFPLGQYSRDAIHERRDYFVLVLCPKLRVRLATRFQSVDHGLDAVESGD
jgi:hypothetical protein